MEKNFSLNGTEVYVFNKYGFKTKPVTKGVIIKSKNSGNLSIHGSIWSVDVYEVLGEDGIKYFGAYEDALYDHYFRTKKNYINFLKSLITYNNSEIDSLKEKNNELEELIEGLEEIKKIDSNKETKKLIKKDWSIVK